MQIVPYTSQFVKLELEPEITVRCINCDELFTFKAKQKIKRRKVKRPYVVE